MKLADFRSEDQPLEQAKLEFESSNRTPEDFERIGARLSPEHRLAFQRFRDELLLRLLPDAFRTDVTVRTDVTAHLPDAEMNAALFSPGAAVSSEPDAGSFVTEDGTVQKWNSFLRKHNLELQTLLGKGSFGQVWLARDTLVNREVAVKIQTRAKQDETRWQAFLHEIKVTGRLRHPNIASLLQAVQVGPNAGYMVYEYVRGKVLQEFIIAGDVTVELAVEWFAKIAIALDHVHENYVVHRDLSTGNIMIDESGQPRLLDFGLSQMHGSAPINTKGLTVGTLQFLSPETAGRSTEANVYSDLFSLGSVLYYTLTKQFPFPGDEPQEVIERITSLTYFPSSARAFNKSIPQQLEQFLRKALSKDPYQRFATGRDFAEALRRSIKPVESKTVAPARQVRVSPRRVMLVAGLTMLCTAFGLFGWFLLMQPAEFAGVHVFQIATNANKVSILDNRHANILHARQSLGLDWVLDGKPLIKPVATVLIAPISRDDEASSGTKFDQIFEPVSNSISIADDKLHLGQNLVLVCLTRTRLSASTWNTLPTAWTRVPSESDTNLYGLVLDSDKLTTQLAHTQVMLRSAQAQTQNMGEDLPVPAEFSDAFKLAMKKLGVRAAFGFVVVRSPENKP